MLRLALMLGLLLAAPAAAQSPFAGLGEPVVVGSGYDVPSQVLGEARHVNVMLPPDYADPKQASARYPVLYLLDGGAGWQDFFHIAGMIHQGNTWGANQPMIVVGVESQDRRAELTGPSADPGEQKDFPTHGKADDFRRFLIDELKPAIDAAYRTDGTDGLMGESLAGYFVVETALRRGAAFDRYIAISPSMWWNGEQLSKDAAALLARPDQPPRTLWLSIADEGGAMQSGMDRLVEALKGQTAVSWSYTPYPHEKHSTIYHPAATRAIRAVFPPLSEANP